MRVAVVTDELRSFGLAEILGTCGIVVQGFLPPEGQLNGVCPSSVFEILGCATSRRGSPGRSYPRACSAANPSG